LTVLENIKGDLRSLKDDRVALFSMSRVNGIGPVTFRRIVSRFGEKPAGKIDSPEALGRAIKMQSSAIEGLKNALSIQGIASAEKDLLRMKKAGIEVVMLGDDHYPPLLAEKRESPPVLYVRGNLEDMRSTETVAIVGTRNPRQESRKSARELARAAGEMGISVVSGMAKGIDAEAHIGALDCGGRTSAVLAGGPDRPFPPENNKLFSLILQNGYVVSGQPPGTRTTKDLLARRNRIIAGICKGVIVIQAPLNSGSMYAVRAALSWGTIVGAIWPGKNVPGFEGNQYLISSGKAIALNPDGNPKEILEQVIEKGRFNRL